MGVYLFIIAAQDVRMRNIFNYEALEWISSSGCQVTGIIAMISCEVSVLLLTFMTAERFLAVVYPLTKKRLSFAKSLMWISAAWIIGMVLSIFPLFLGDSLGNFYGSNAVCFPLTINDPYRKGWQYSAFLFLGINFVAFFAIAVLYSVMMVNIIKTRQQAVGQPLRLDLVVVRRFTLIVLTDALCWIPIAVIKICALWHVTMSG
jgi:leucine-rich repeat-containing G protein-coupled receptor 7